jgi:ADP-ribosylation factor GTPase-activating protein 1
VGEQRMNSVQEKKKLSGIGTSVMKKSGGDGGKKADGEWGEW